MKKIFIVVAILGVVMLASKYLMNQKVSQNVPLETDNASYEGSNLLTEDYTDPEFGYSIKLPTGYRIESEGKYSKRFLPDTKITGFSATNFVYVSVVTPEMKDSQGEIYNYSPDQFDKLMSLENLGDSANLADSVSALAEWYTYTLVSEEDIDSQKARNFQNNKPWEFPKGTSENRFVFEKSENMYVLGYYTGGDGIDENSRLDPRLAFEIVKSFKTQR